MDTRSATIRVDPDAARCFALAGTAALATFTGRRTLRLELVREPFAERVRLRLVQAEMRSNIVPPKEFSADRPFRITIEGEDRTYYRVTVADSSQASSIVEGGAGKGSPDWVLQPNVLKPGGCRPKSFSRASIGARLTREDTPPLEQCEELLP